MQIGQTQGINQYRAVAQTAQAAETSQAAGEKTQSTETRTNTDRVELSSYSTVWKLNGEDRAALVESLKTDQKNQMDHFVNMMTGIFQKQGLTAATAGSNAFWQMISGGQFTVDAETQKAAQQAISEDGYWGVKQTSERIFSMAAALAGDNVELMEKLQAAVDKGFQQAGVAWGGKLPSITDDTHEAVNKMFDDYYAAVKGTSEEPEEAEEPEAAEETEEASETPEESDEPEESDSVGGKVGFNEAKRARQLAAAVTKSDVTALMALLQQDLSDCKAGLEKGWCDEAEVAKVEAMISRAKQHMSQVPDSAEQSGGVSAFELASLM